MDLSMNKLHAMIRRGDTWRVFREEKPSEDVRITSVYPNGLVYYVGVVGGQEESIPAQEIVTSTNWYWLSSEKPVVPYSPTKETADLQLAILRLCEVLDIMIPVALVQNSDTAKTHLNPIRKLVGQSVSVDGNASKWLPKSERPY